MGTLSQIPLAEAVEISSDSVFGNTQCVNHFLDR
jgi:hypothetical protein